MKMTKDWAARLLGGSALVSALFVVSGCGDDEDETSQGTEVQESDKSAAPKADKSEAATTKKNETPIKMTGSFEGTYTVSGSTEFRDGTLKITKNEDTYHLEWENGHEGVGIERGDILAASFGKPGPGQQGFVNGISVLDIDGGNIKGRWADFKRKNWGTESLEGPPGLSGLYLKEGTNQADDSTFEGTTEILMGPRDSYYHLVDRIRGAKKQTWIGYALEGTLVTAYGSFVNNRMVIYQRDGDTLKGTIVQEDMVSLGRETAKKQKD